jgi:hypothetical protein
VNLLKAVRLKGEGLDRKSETWSQVELMGTKITQIERPQTYSNLSKKRGLKRVGAIAVVLADGVRGDSAGSG